MDFTESDLATRMKLHTSVSVNNEKLPSLTELELKYGLPPIQNDSQSEAESCSRSRLLHMYNFLPIVEHVQCPVCIELCTSTNMVICCDRGHHICLACAVKICGQDNILDHRCPVCKNIIVIRTIPMALKNIIDTIAPAHLIDRNTHVRKMYTKYIDAMTNLTITRRQRMYSYDNVVIFARMEHAFGDDMERILDVCIEYKHIQQRMQNILDNFRVGST
jgi:hypothetical protein